MNNGTMLQFFEWFLPADQMHWSRCAARAQSLADMGFTSVWLPPAYKGAGGRYDIGYGVYDTYDLGEFDQKGSVATKYGARQEYLEAVEALQSHGIQVYADIVLNHRIGADGQERVLAVQDDETDRNREVAKAREISAWTKFDFPGRGDKYSDFHWNWNHFDGTDWDEDWKYKGIFRFAGKSWDRETDTENGNYDYLMGADVDLGNPQVRRELISWGRWYYETVHMDGFRLDAVKHMDFTFYTEWLDCVRKAAGRELFAVGEYWSHDVSKLIHYQESSHRCMSLFDVPLHFQFQRASTSNGNFDMSRIFDGTMVQADPLRAVTFVDNHDTQPGQALSSWVAEWFKPIAYALILLRKDGYPCVFYGDLYGIPHDKADPVDRLPVLIRARSLFAYGEQHDYFDDGSTVGWTREGDEEHEDSGMAVVVTDGAGGFKTMYVGKRFAGQPFYDCMFGGADPVVIGEDGTAAFGVSGGDLSVWVTKNAYRRLTV